MKRQGVAESSAARWTRAEDYLYAMGRERSASRRRNQAEAARTEPQAPRVLLSTVPFIGLIALLGVLAIAIMIVAFPGTQSLPHETDRQPAQKELGVAPRGWMQEAQKDFHR